MGEHRQREAMDLDRLRALVALSQETSVAAVARKLGTSERTVRKRISEVQDEVGVPLVQRRGRRLALTPAGAAFARGGRDILTRAHQAIQGVKTAPGQVVGAYRVAIPMGLPPQLNAAAIAGHFAHFPDLRLHIHPVPRPLALLPHAADIAITFEPRPTSGPWLSAEVRRVPEVVLASRGYIERHGAPERVEELHQHTLLSWLPPGEDAGEWPLRTGGSVSVEPVLVSADILLVRHCMAAGMGLARVPHSGLPDLGSVSDAVVVVLPESLGRDLALRVVMSDTPTLRAAYRQYIGSIRSISEDF